MGLDVELEHGLVDSHTNVTNDDPIMSGENSTKVLKVRTTFGGDMNLTWRLK